MATDVSESSGADCKGDTRNSAKLDSEYPLRVLYCGGKCWKEKEMTFAHFLCLMW
ncbi:Density-regulated protein [Cricetulus griseus]|uniref:Density-regulated protein n=1 Tax=Cricetulus griseus TaxID=10029 RepID=G3IC04_CRIGR|nr:Density-regulated protein [Cricetulus griseus]